MLCNQRFFSMTITGQETCAGGLAISIVSWILKFCLLQDTCWSSSRLQKIQHTVDTITTSRRGRTTYIILSNNESTAFELLQNLTSRAITAVVPSRPFESLAVNNACPLPKTKSRKQLLVETTDRYLNPHLLWWHTILYRLSLITRFCILWRQCIEKQY